MASCVLISEKAMRGGKGTIIGVAGAGAWGMALANAASAAGRHAILWGRDPERMRKLEASRLSDKLPGVSLAAGVRATTVLDDLAPASAILIATPAQATRETAAKLARDRKSTRLNSSHITISYAVFCLKKKKK